MPEQQNGNLLLERSHATLTNGQSIEMVDAYFQIEPTVNEEAKATAPATNPMRDDVAMRIPPHGGPLFRLMGVRRSG